MSCHQAYLQEERHRSGILAALAAVAVLLTCCDLAAGSAGLSLSTVLQALMAGPEASTPDGVIIWSIRLPMTLTALLVGAGLSLAGLQIQAITGNALASPSTLGITSGACFGAAAAITLGLTVAGELWLGTIASAFVCALGISALILSLGRLRGMTPSTLILAGIVMNFFFIALQQYLQYRASPETAQLIAGWTFGNLERSTWLAAAAAGLALIAALLWFVPHVWQLTTLSLGEERARSLGIQTGRLRLVVFGASSLLVAAAVSFIGTIAFVGLVAPHCTKMLLGADQRFLIPGSLLVGGNLMLLSSLLAKALSQGAMLPVGIVTSIVGVPFLFFLLLRDRGRY